MQKYYIITFYDLRKKLNNPILQCSNVKRKYEILQ